jgi:hypothetical protein
MGKRNSGLKDQDLTILFYKIVSKITLVSFASFKDKIIEFRKKVEEWKDNHKMASQAVSAVIDSLPQPFDKFFGVVWNGLEKENRDDSAQKLITLIEKFESVINRFIQVSHCSVGVKTILCQCHRCC